MRKLEGVGEEWYLLVSDAPGYGEGGFLLFPDHVVLPRSTMDSTRCTRSAGGSAAQN